MLPAPPWQKPARGPRPARRSLSQDGIVDAAMDILDREGLDAVTMRRVAQALDTGPASLYAHVSGKDELHALIFDRIVGEVVPPAPDPARWQEQVKQVMRDAERVLARHPGAARLALARIPATENALVSAEGLLAILRAGGVPDQMAAYAIDVLNLFTTATAFEASLYLAAGSTEESMQAQFGQLREYFEALPADRFPNLVALAGAMVSGSGDERFEFGLEILVSGIAAAARRAAGGTANEGGTPG
jgi:AcrR family transcriptional regulator